MNDLEQFKNEREELESCFVGLDRIDQAVKDGFRLKLFKRLIIKDDEDDGIAQIIDGIRGSYPEEFEKAIAVLKNSEFYVDKAKEYALRIKKSVDQYEAQKKEEIKQEIEQLLADAHNEAESIKADANMQAEQMISESNITAEANRRADELMENTRQQCNEMLESTNAECDNIKNKTIEDANKMREGAYNYSISVIQEVGQCINKSYAEMNSTFESFKSSMQNSHSRVAAAMNQINGNE